MSNVAEIMRLVQSDCKQDAELLDRTAFTPRGVGEAFGNVLAMIAAVARGVEVLAEKIEAQP